MIVHLQTMIQTTFGVVDDKGNVIPQQPIQAELLQFDAKTFADAHGAIATERNRAIANYEAQRNGNTAGADAEIRPGAWDDERQPRAITGG